MHVLITALVVLVGVAWGLGGGLLWPGLTFWLVTGCIRGLARAVEGTRK